MPGILPMKVIKVGTNAQTRIAQACDRCRSKKIRCDGVRPCCSQCANVGFECKTSDKLSRRAFPRGYTESLEERVRALEAEVRELKELLDEKDEKIDMLSRIHSQSSHPLQLLSPRRPSSEPRSVKVDIPLKDDIFKVRQSAYLLDSEGSDSYFAGTSSCRNFIEAYKEHVRQGGRSSADINTDSLLATSLRRSPESAMTTSKDLVVYKVPPRLVSDQLINIYFQEWAPLFPILHRPTFLALYERCLNDYDSVDDKAVVSQLNLVFGIATLSKGDNISEYVESFESQWKSALDCIVNETSITTLQALILAQLFCIQQGDLIRLQTYKGLSTSLSARLGLHQSQKRFALGTLTCETRKKVFWTLYTIDTFTAVLLGLPKHLKDDDVHCEYPDDVDDEYITDQGFQPTVPGESTKISSALSLFRASRILSKVLEKLYPEKASYELSLKKLNDLSDELDLWSKSLPCHLRLQFAQDKPSTGTISSRSPLLSLTYHYIRALIHRPAVCASLDFAKSQSSMIAMASSCKHIVQILQLLDERGLTFSFCLNRDEVLVHSGIGLLFQGLGLDPSSKILKDNHKMITAVIDVLKKSSAPCVVEFERAAALFVPCMATPTASILVSRASLPVLSRHNSSDDQTTSVSRSPPSPTNHLEAIASRVTAKSETPKLDYPESSRRATIHDIDFSSYDIHNRSQSSLAPSYDPSSISRSEPARSPINICSQSASGATARPSAPPVQVQHLKPKPKPKPRQSLSKLPNLDYLSFGSDVENSSPPKVRPAQPIKSEPSPTDWEKLLGSLDNGDTNIYDACYGGPPVDALLDVPPLALCCQTSSLTTAAAADASPATWSAEMWEMCQADTNSSPSTGLTPVGRSHTLGSTLSFTKDEAPGTEDVSYGGVVLLDDESGLGNDNWEISLNL